MSEIDPNLSRLYREASREEPPAALDAAVLAAARKRAVKPRSRELSSWWRWMAPASAIATLALGVSLALLIERERPETADQTGMRQTPPSTPPSAPTLESAKPKAADGAAPPAAPQREAPAATIPAQAPAAPAFPAERRAKASATPMAAPEVVVPQAAAPKAAMESNVSADSAPGAAGTAAPAAAGRLAPLRDQPALRSPEAWLEAISRLKQAGRDQEAAEQLAQFRKAYPGHAVPESLLSK